MLKRGNTYYWMCPRYNESSDLFSLDIKRIKYFYNILYETFKGNEILMYYLFNLLICTQQNNKKNRKRNLKKRYKGWACLKKRFIYTISNLY